MAKQNTKKSQKQDKISLNITFSKRTAFFVGGVVLFLLLGLLVWRGSKNIEFDQSSDAVSSFTCEGENEGDRDGNPGDYKNSYCDTGQGICVDVHYQENCSDDYRVRVNKPCSTNDQCHRWKVKCFTHEYCGNGTKDKTRWRCDGGSRRNCIVGTCSDIAPGVAGHEPIPDTDACQEKGYAVGQPISDDFEVETLGE
jgi:hypothetical protein